MASFTFNDGTGSQTLSCSYPFPANRFKDWTPIPKYIGERAVAWGDRRRYQYIGATSQRARGILPGITYASEQVLRAFKLWAEGGGTFTTTTDDAEANVYADCQLASDENGNLLDLEILFDPTWGEYSVVFDIEHVGSPQQVLRAVYLASATTVLNAASGTYTISGPDAELHQNQLAGASGSYAIAGADATTSVT